VRSLLERLLAAVAEECPAAWRAMSAHRLSISVAVEGERFGLEVGEAGPALSPPPVCGPRLECDRTTLRRLVTGEQPVLAALRGDELRLFGAPGDLVRLDELVRLLVAGAARSPRAALLFDEFLAETGEQSHEV